MKIAALDNPVRASWLVDQGFRLDPASYLSGSFEARKLLERLPRTEPLHKLTAGYGGGIFNGPKFSRLYTHSREHGVPFLGSTDMLEADFSSLPLLHRKVADKLGYLKVSSGTTLVSCSGNVGRTAFVRDDMDGFSSSQHVMKVVPDPDKITPGYLYATLAGPLGRAIVSGAAYGAIIQHIEPHHIADLPIPRLPDDVERQIDRLIQDAAGLRSRYQAKIDDATRDVFHSSGIPELLKIDWHDQPRDISFCVSGLTPVTMRALNFMPRAHRILSRLLEIPHRTLGDVCSGGRLSRGSRFKRVDSEPGNGVQLVGQRQGFWLRPEGRWIQLSEREETAVRAADETILVASQGTLGESEVFCRPILAAGSWVERYVFSEHFLRVVSGDPQFPGAYLFAYLRSEAVFRILRSLSTGGKQQDIHEVLRAEIPVPECTQSDRERIAETVRAAYRDRDEADKKEDQAFKLLDDAVREAAR